MTLPVLILGKGGQLGRALAEALGDGAVAASSNEVDLSAADFIRQLEKFLGGRKISAVMSAAAYTQVDKAETEENLAFRINAEAVGELAAWCKAQAVPLIHVSTDYVFDGSGNTPRAEDAPVNPLNIYGKSKLAGEQLVVQSGADYLIFRTSWVYDATGKNFYNSMRRLFAERETLAVVADQMGAPTYAPHLAQGMIAALQKAAAMPQFPSDIYHLCGGGETSWHGFAESILAQLRARSADVKCQEITPITSAEYPVAAKRPLNSRLDCSKAKKTFGVALPDWQEGLAQCISETYGNRTLRD